MLIDWDTRWLFKKITPQQPASVNFFLFLDKISVRLSLFVPCCSQWVYWAYSKVVTLLLTSLYQSTPGTLPAAFIGKPRKIFPDRCYSICRYTSFHQIVFTEVIFILLFLKEHGVQYIVCLRPLRQVGYSKWCRFTSKSCCKAWWWQFQNWSC